MKCHGSSVIWGRRGIREEDARGGESTEREKKIKGVSYHSLDVEGRAGVTRKLEGEEKLL